MKISHRYKFIFFCNPKTGSESVRDLLEPFSDFSSTIYRHRTAENPFYSHMRPAEAKPFFEQFGWDFDSYRKFVFVRNPWARLVSLYEMIRQNAGQTSSKSDFSQWLLSTKPYGAGGGGEDWKRWRKYGSYSIKNYVADDDGAILVDRILKLENIATELREYLSDLGIPNAESIEIPHTNQRDKKHHYSRYYSSVTDAFIKENYAYDIKHFDYELEAA